MQKMKKMRFPLWCVALIVVGILLHVLFLYPLFDALRNIEVNTNTPAKSADCAKLSLIGKSYTAFVRESASLRIIRNGTEIQKNEADSPAAFAELLSKKGGLNLGEIWYVKGDVALKDKAIPQQVLSEKALSKNLLHDVRPISYAIVINIPPEKWADKNYPIAWTRGLQDDGTWAKNSPWNGEGGLVCFSDGGVRWFSKVFLPENGIVDGAGRVVTSVREWIGNEAIVLEDNVSATAPKSL